MAIALRIALLLSLAGCAGMAPTSAPAQRTASPCDAQGEASYACQVERYNRVSG
jgi:hypothetical protein